MTKKRYDPDELVSLPMEPAEALEAILGGAGTADEDWEMDTEGSDSDG
jgi:hypothetical protein